MAPSPWRRLCGAVQFLTLVPVRGSTAGPGESAVFFPLIGAVLGGAVGLLCASLRPHLGCLLAASISIAAAVCATGALHEDGAADVCDAVRAGRSREKILDILKDSRIGTYGGLALAGSLILRSAALSRIEYPLAPACAAVFCLSRASLVLLAAIAQPVGGGLGSAFRASLTRPMIWTVAIQAILAACIFAPYRAFALIVSTALILAAAHRYFALRLGGVTGDCLGATSQAVEVALLLLLAWRA